MAALGSCSADTAYRRYSESMRRPDIELTEDAARFVERHPDLIARLAGATDTTAPDPDRLDAQRGHFRGYVRERLAFARTDEARSAGAEFLARFAAR
jgi:hypothetical protein